jgi:transcriptional regulator with XRE-family HTH domain
MRLNKPKVASARYGAFGELLAELRRKAGMAHQSDLAARVKSRQQTVSRWEAGLSRPRDTQVPVIAKALNADIAELLRAAGYSTKAPAATFDQPFPIDALSPESFERFSFHLLQLLHPGAIVHRAGATGHAQEGLDIEVQLAKNRRYTFQCKRVDEFGPSKVHKAVADHTRNAIKKFILLSRIASPQARDAIQQHAGWDIWDKEDISLRIRNLPKREQIRLVDMFFRGQRLALLGEVEAGPWQTPDEFFAPFLTGHGVFSHAWQLVGKGPEVEALKAALLDEKVRAVFLTGAGGAGKSRIVKEAIEALPPVPNSLVVFLSPTEEVTNKSLEDLGERMKILVVDDAHDRADLQLLFQFAAVPENKATLLLAFRPYGLEYIKAQAAGFAVAGERVREVKLEPLTLDEATRLAQQALEQHGGPAALAKDIARLTRDCPLATVVGAIVVSKDKRHIMLVGNEDQFRSTLLGRFQDVIAGEIGGSSDADPIRRLLRVLALLQPIHLDEESVANVAERIEHIPPHEFHRLTRLLAEAGVLFRRGGMYRLSPDLLGDQIIESACIANGGGSTGYAERVFDAASDAYLEHVLLNLGKLDWRRANGDPSSSRLLDGVWAKLRPESEYRDPHVGAVSAVAYYQPGRALDFAETLIRKGEYLRDVPAIIKHAAYNYGHLRRACEQLWELGKNDARELGREPSHAVRILSELCAVEPNKPRDYNEVVVDFGLSLLPADDAMTGAYTPFDFLAGILAAEGHTTTSNGKTMSWNQFNVAPQFVAPLRAKVVDASIALLTHPNARTGVLAARFLQKALHYGMNCTPEVRKLWTKEFVSTLGKIERTVRTGALDALILVEIVQSIGWHAHHQKHDTAEAARRVLNAIPDTFEFRTAVALLNAYSAVLGRQDLALLAKEAGERLDALVREWLAAYPEPEDLRAALAKAIQHIDLNAGLKTTGSSEFFWRLIQASPALARVIVDDALADPNSRTRLCAGVALAKMMLDDRAAGSRAISRVLEEGAPDLVSSAGRAYRIVGIKEARADDLANVAKLLGSADERVVLSAIGILMNVANEDARTAAELILHVNLGLSHQVADEVLMLFYQEEKGLFEQFTVDGMEQVLRRLEVLPELEGHWIDSFLSRASRTFPRLTAEFFMRRVERAADKNDWQLRPCNFGPYGQVPLLFRQTAEFPTLLRDIATWMNARDSKDFLFHERAKQLFGAMFSPFDDVLVGFLRDWIRVATSADLHTICSILDEAPNDFVFAHRSFVDEVLRKAKQLGRKPYERAISVLYGSAISGIRTGTPGEPFPQDLKMKADAEKALKEILRFSPSYEVYDDIRKCADERIARSLKEAERYEE